MELKIYVTGYLNVSPKYYYNKNFIKNEKLGKITRIPVFSFLISDKRASYLIGAGMSKKNPFGNNFLSHIMNYLCKPVLCNPIGKQLGESTKNKLKGIVCTNFMPDCITGINSLNNISKKICYSSKAEIKNISGIFGCYSSIKKMLSEYDIKSIDNIKNDLENMGIEILSLPGNTFGDNIGLYLKKEKIVLVGNAIETPYSPFFGKYYFIGNKKSQKETNKKLIELMNQGIVLISNHDPSVKADFDNFIGSAQHRELLERQKAICKRYL